MKQMGNFLRILMLAVILLGQPGCAMIAGKLAIAGGKKIYHKMEDDKAAKNEQAEQE